MPRHAVIAANTLEPGTVLSKNDSNPSAVIEHGVGKPPLASPADAAHFRLLPVFGGLEVMEGAFVHHHFAPHSHDEMMIGVLHTGSLRFRRGRTTHVVGRGGLSIVNPGDVHTGGRHHGDVLTYTALYPGTDVLERAGIGSAGDFSAAVLDDAALWHALFEATRRDTEPLRTEELIVQTLAVMGARYGDAGAGRRDGPACQSAVRRAVDYVEAHYDEDLTLDRLSTVAGIGARHLIRSFRRATGLTPHAFVRQTRVWRAREALRRGAAPADAAYATGFADQAHLTRVFKLLIGTTPGRYASCFRA